MNMTPTEKIKVLLDRKKMTIGTLADVTGQTRQNLSNKLKRDNFSYNELKAIAAALGCTLDITFIDNESSERL